ncbi:MAG TPA: ATP-dependent helicase [Runella sp.]|nr:ATP-dependent helicase [Runella sp.]HAO51442.1 ATP-dependent helicase [Runella sp.]
MKFEDYHISGVVKQNLEKLGFRRPTDIQYKAIPSILKGEDVLAIAQTGTGKTAAFAIPILHLLHERKRNSRRPDGVKCVVMVPTHELALQITEVFERLGKGSDVKTLALFGGVAQDPQIARLDKGMDIVVATPGRLFDLVSQGHLRLERVELLVLDEADHMLDLGFIKDIRDLLKHLPRRRQTLFFSATIDDKIKKLAYSIIHSAAIRIQISPKDPVSKNVDHFVTYVEMDDKRFFLERLINEHPDSKIMVFVRTKVRAERVAHALERMEIQCMTLHGDKEQKERSLALGAFKSGKTKVLIATDISARGIDIPNVDYVVNYDLPDEVENYVHRVGRTGRGTQRGSAVSFCSTEEKPKLAAIEEYVGKPVTVLQLSKAEYDGIVDTSNDPAGNIKSLLQEIEDLEADKKLRQGRKRGKKKRG